MGEKVLTERLANWRSVRVQNLRCHFGGADGTSIKMQIHRETPVGARVDGGPVNKPLRQCFQIYRTKDAAEYPIVDTGAFGAIDALICSNFTDRDLQQIRLAEFHERSDVI